MKLPLTPILLFSLCLLVSCQESEEQHVPLLKAKLIDSSLSRLSAFSVFQNKAAIQGAQNLQAVTSAFLKTTDNGQLQKVHLAWQNAHNKYLASKYGLFMPLDERRALLFAIESWPIQPGFIDSLPNYPSSGIVNDITLNMDLPTLREQHGITDREEVCLGFHAVEYLIFERSIEHFSAEFPRKTAESSTRKEDSVERRRLLLQLLVDELVNNMNQSALLMAKQFSTQEDITNQDKIYHFLHNTADNLQGLQRASSLLFDLNASHGHYSETSLNALAVELTTLEAFYLGDVDLMPLLMAIDLTTAANFNKTLLDAVALIRDPEAGETEFAKLPLMISALAHQLENFESILGRNL